ncbi:MAG: hypothetical protein Q8O67_32730 [Deltaproteobacteria bacterium]|nr:hypothetical protein [Deltaproteobacteria bacterium]
MKALLPLLLVGALSVPGPCVYDAHTELDCTSNDDCTQFGPDSTCLDDGRCSGANVDQPSGQSCNGQVCAAGQLCTAEGCVNDSGNECGACTAGFRCDTATRTCVDDGGGGGPCDLRTGQNCGADEDCVTPLNSPVANEGACAAPSATPAALGASCVPSSTTNPCDRNALCVQTGPNTGVCLSRCNLTGATPDERCTNPDLRCGRPHVSDGGGAAGSNVELCLPRCNIDNGASDCPGGMNLCSIPNDAGGSCLPDNGVCGVVGCGPTGCEGTCTVDGGECGAIACGPNSINDPCGTREVLTCSGGPGLNENCQPFGAACGVGLSCAPRDPGSFTCAQQAAATTPDTGACDVAAGGNVCEAGAFCAPQNGLPAPNGTDGTCLRLCDGAHPCGRAGTSCELGVEAMNTLEVCVPACGFVGAVAPTCAGGGPGWGCALETGTGCQGDGFCRVARNDAASIGAPCATNASCSAGLVCAGSSCQPIASACP